ncbi:DEAD/DEAH box helicase [uncultured Desulfosarcina sp.]|uniref:DEAD/DEAH box helicase n=1 Tax=uncultured Desulfosarcina sp. TaxID=218289 RepID=UPI0029C8101A|nr:DEAD/DEAH box helicase [uncultured Desulfosarcina sp.]
MRTLRDKLSHLSFLQAAKLLGPRGRELIMEGGKFEIDLVEQVTLDDRHFRLTIEEAVVTIGLTDDKRQRFDLCCNACSGACVHQGAALSLVLEEKLALGLSAPPPERTPIESLDEAALIEQAINERRQRARDEKMRLQSMNPQQLWTDYVITNPLSGKSYRLALRGWEPGESYCACPDFRKNTLGTCKHILYALERGRAKFPKSVKDTPAIVEEIGVYLRYGRHLELHLLLPDQLEMPVQSILAPLKDTAIDDPKDLLQRIGQVERLGRSVTIYPDAEEYIQQLLFQQRMAAVMAEIRRDPAAHPLRKTLLKTDLRPYQLDGIAFAAGTGRAVLADDMGLGKTIQGIGTAELLSRHASVSKVLVICPASLKSQWRSEIRRFSDRSVRLILGSHKERPAQYAGDQFYTVCNYEQVLRDILAIERVAWDLIILDEGQRIKNWEAKTSRIVKALKSPFALVLSGTPLENRLDELFSVVEFIDDRRLGPAFRFFNRHRVVDEKGKLLGYKRLDRLREALRPIMLRRTRRQVLDELPPRTTEVIRIAPTEEQLDMQKGHRNIVQTIINKKYLSEMDLLRLQKALLMCRMCADSTFLVDKQAPGYSSKLKELGDLLERLKAEADRKIVLFSEWTTMLNLIEPLLEVREMNYVRLDGSVPQKKRQELIHRFQSDPSCMLFITTNAGATGLNLQAANTVINVDLPWNPAVLEQRISRVHRMGQQQSVQVFLLVTADTLEENLLGTLSAKHQLSLAVLDPDTDTSQVEMSTGMEELKRRMEILLGARPEAAEDESMKADAEKTAAALVRKEKVAAAGGQLMGAAFAFIGEMFADRSTDNGLEQLAGVFKAKLGECMERSADGRLNMTITLPDEAFLDTMARSLARMVGLGTKP